MATDSPHKATLAEFLAQNPFVDPLTLGLFYREKMRAIHRVAPDTPFRLILEIGGGRSGLTALLYPQALVINVDPDPSHATEAVNQQHTMRFVCGTATTLPFSDDSFDAVTVFDVIEHIDDDAGAAAEVERVIKPGGYVLLTTPIEHWRSIAGQGVELMGLSIADNIRYGRPEATIEEIVTAAREVDAHDFIAQLPQGYDTILDRWHGTLSGGQRQRIALARALVRHPEVLILDEATSELDSATESLIQDVLKHLKGRITIVIIAHRLSTIRNADRVIVLDEGRVVETGTPGELLDQEGTFAQLAMFQNEWVPVERSQ